MSKERIKQLVEYVNAPENGYSNKTIKAIINLVNRVARRNVTVENTDSITLSKHNDWISEGENSCEYHDVTKLKADVNVSNFNHSTTFDNESVNLTNAIKPYKSGLYVADYKPILDNLANKLNTNITKTDAKFSDVDTKISKNKNDITSINTEIATIKDDILNANDNIQDNISSITSLTGRVNTISTFPRLLVKPNLKSVNFTIENDSLSPIANFVEVEEKSSNAPVFLYNHYQLTEKPDVNRWYGFYRLSFNGFNFNNVTSGAKILSIPISVLRQTDISQSFINTANTKGIYLTDGYFTEELKPIRFKIVATANATNYINTDTLDVYVYSDDVLSGSVVESDNLHNIIQQIQ